MEQTISPTLFSATIIICLLAGAFIGYVLRRSGEKIDPWEMMQRIMRKSGQPTPDFVQLNKYSITYLALCMEELAETIAPVNSALLRHGRGAEGVENPVRDTIRTINTYLTNIRNDLAQMSRVIRATNERLPENWVMLMTGPEINQFTDGCVDQAVVVCGLTVASGIPGSPCYEEVASSNLSKANPITGRIDKDASGKWVKGPNFFSPDLMAVLRAHGAVPGDDPQSLPAPLIG